MLAELSVRQKVFMYILFALTAIALAMGIYAGYNYMLVAKPRTLGVSYATVLTASSGEEPICEVSIWDNSKNNGLQAYEVRWNSYTDAEGSWVKGFGLQVTGDIWGVEKSCDISVMGVKWINSLSNSFVQNSTVVYGDWSLYQSDDLGDTSYRLDRAFLEDCLYIDIEGEFYQIVLNNYSWTTTDYNWLGWKSGTTEHSAKYTWFDLTKFVINSALSDSAKTKYDTFYIDLLECSTYYHLLYQTSNGQYKELPEVSDLKNYLQIKVNYHADGITDASESMFGQVNNNPSWNFWEGTNVEDFWSVKSQIYLDESNVTKLTLEATGETYISVDKSFSQYLKGLDAEFYININLDNLGWTASGIVMDNFNFNIKEINITSSSEQEFVVVNATTITPTITLGGDA